MRKATESYSTYSSLVKLQPTVGPEFAVKDLPLGRTLMMMMIKKPEIIPEMPRKTAVAKFRLITEHDYLAKHLNKIGIFASPNCPLCNSEEEMTEEHLETCKALPAGSIIEKYWSA